MLVMILKMSGVTVLYIILTILIWKRTGGRKITWKSRIAIGLIYGLCSVLSTHFGIDYVLMRLNVRDMGPLAAGLFFDPVSGIIAGLIGGIERYYAAVLWNIGAFTRDACSVSTCLAGFLAAFLSRKLFRGKKPGASYSFMLGAVMEVFHMYAIFISHREDIKTSLTVVSACSWPMMIFTGLGLAGVSIALQVMAGEWRNPLRRIAQDKQPLSHRFQVWLFGVTSGVLVLTFLACYILQSSAAVQNAETSLNTASEEVLETLHRHPDSDSGRESVMDMFSGVHVMASGTIDFVRKSGVVIGGYHQGQRLPQSLDHYRSVSSEKGTFTATLFGQEMMGKLSDAGNNMTILAMIPVKEIYSDRDAQVYEIVFSDVLLFAVIFALVSLLVQHIVVDNLSQVNVSLDRITGGNLNELVNVRESSEFSSLSNDINLTVSVLKGYITAAEKRMEKELALAHSIQDSALPRNFTFHRNDFSIYALMRPAKEVGGDFYDFFMVDSNKMALVIADVSGKGIPAAMFMMRAKTTIRNLAEAGHSPSEVLFRANNILCEGNEAEMFVTVWIGIIDLTTGVMICANAGHEYPAIMRAGEGFELFKDRHGLVLAAMENVRAKEYEIQMHPGDKLFVYTDGVPEAINSAEEQYGTGRMVQALNNCMDLPVDRLLPGVLNDLDRYVAGEEPFDDTTMLGFVYEGSAAE